jgi:hypothetical protein
MTNFTHLAFESTPDVVKLTCGHIPQLILGVEDLTDALDLPRLVPFIPTLPVGFRHG